jgi:hypothetical protein
MSIAKYAFSAIASLSEVSIWVETGPLWQIVPPDSPFVKSRQDLGDVDDRGLEAGPSQASTTRNLFHEGKATS